MIIAGLRKNSLVDYRGKVAAVVFVPFCNYNCFYCHNRILLESNPEKVKYRPTDSEEFFAFLEKRRGLLQGVVITGGEPTLHNDLGEFIDRIKETGYPVKLDTNGYRPDVIEELISKKKLDSIAMDIKGPIEKYPGICGVPVDEDKIRKSISLILSSGIEYEFRTTVPPGFTLKDIEESARLIEGAHLYYLQQFRKPENTGEFTDIRNNMKPNTREFFREAVEICRPFVREVNTRGINIDIVGT
ncbi:MAG TPA: anaerobic ribonucleoside-triphosphate reductase activating protein [Clostridia bacterium]|nr:anaerobic ribonucleoside-triphosphate reductase activating protein [Clostridia bacterium]HRX41157.1 anaerobic ribonucleoside-triphosphate reductase activating protein [Clostridia bacterium]